MCIGHKSSWAGNTIFAGKRKTMFLLLLHFFSAKLFLSQRKGEKAQGMSQRILEMKQRLNRCN